MSKATQKVTALNVHTLRALQADMQAALQEVAQRYGVSIKDGGHIRERDEQSAVIKLRVGIITPDGAIASPERSSFLQFAHVYGLQKEQLDTLIRVSGTEYQIVGLRTSSRRQPIVVKRCSDERMFVMPPEMVKKGITAWQEA